ncbi:MAG TPA: DNA-processing protein DprA, partial [Bacteroidota bacterium]|nr:DNA-processing protein DprA [Bacteroidota bacterium]
MIPAFDLLVLNQIPNIGSNRLRMLSSHFEDYTQIYDASPKEFARVEGIHKKIASQISHFLKSDDLDLAKKHAEKQLSMINKIGGGIITYWDKNYPELLKKIYDPPVFLFLRGMFDPSDRYSLAIVGTRTPT